MGGQLFLTQAWLLSPHVGCRPQLCSSLVSAGPQCFTYYLNRASVPRNTSRSAQHRSKLLSCNTEQSEPDRPTAAIPLSGCAHWNANARAYPIRLRYAHDHAPCDDDIVHQDTAVQVPALTISPVAVCQDSFGSRAKCTT